MDPDEAILIVNVTDVNDNSPSFVGLPFTFTAPPGAGVNQLIGAVKAVDPDISSTVHYGIISGNDDATAFRIDPNSGQIFTAANLDSIDKMIFTISVNASDGTFTTNATVQVHESNIFAYPKLYAAKTITDKDCCYRFSKQRLITKYH